MLKNVLGNLRTSPIQGGLVSLWNTPLRSLGSRICATPTAQHHHNVAATSKQHILPSSHLIAARADRSKQQQQNHVTDNLSNILSRLSLSPEEATATVKYRLPSRLPETQVAILDPVASSPLPWDCPTAVIKDTVDAPTRGTYEVYIDDPTATGKTIEKRASNILEKRHKKMKRHQYKKWRKRNRFKLRAQKMRRRKKRKEKWERHLNQYRFTELSAADKEHFLAKKRERLHIYLRYMGVDVPEEKMEEVGEEEGVVKKKKRGPRGSIAPGATGRIVPSPIVPEGATIR